MARRKKFDKPDDKLQIRVHKELGRRFRTYMSYSAFKTQEETLKALLDIAENKSRIENPRYPF